MVACFRENEVAGFVLPVHAACTVLRQASEKAVCTQLSFCAKCPFLPSHPCVCECETYCISYHKCTNTRKALYVPPILPVATAERTKFVCCYHYVSDTYGLIAQIRRTLEIVGRPECAQHTVADITCVTHANGGHVTSHSTRNTNAGWWRRTSSHTSPPWSMNSWGKARHRHTVTIQYG